MDSLVARPVCASGARPARGRALYAVRLAEATASLGGGIRDVRVGHARGRLVCEVVDRGNGFDDPTAGYLAPREETGSGLWVAGSSRGRSNSSARRLDFPRACGC